MKIWYHLIASLVGLAVAALIVYAVFGSASEQGATQDGAAPGVVASDGEALCGTVKPSETKGAKARAAAGKNLPALYDVKGPFSGFTNPDQQAWAARLHAASGICIDELHILEDRVLVVMSTIDSVDEADAGAYVMATIAQSFTPPLQRPSVTVTATIDGKDRTISISFRTWRQFKVRAAQVKQPLTTANLVQFRTAVAPSGLAIRGWS